MTDRDEQIRSRCEAATPGPWKVIEKGNTVPSIAVATVPYGHRAQEMICPNMSPKTGNAAFIAASRSDIPYLLDRVAELEREIERLREAQRWIPVTERLPEEDGRYLCAMDRVAPEYLGGCDREVRIMRLRGTMWRIPKHIPNWINGEIIDKVTHWRTLPELPQEG